MKTSHTAADSDQVKCPNCILSTVIHKYNSNKFQIFFCQKCLNGFTYPVPKNLGSYYKDTYWVSKGPLGILKNIIYRTFQIRRKYWVMRFLRGGAVLDVGSGEGIFSTYFDRNFQVISLDVPSAKILNPKVIKTDFLKWSPKNKFDAVVFWESLEHTALPQKYIKRAASILKPGGYLFIEYPRYNSWEASLFKNCWFHLDPPRHLSHLTPEGLDKLILREKLTSINHRGVFALEYTIGGFAVSILNLLPKQPTDFLQNSKNLPLIFVLIPLIFIAALFETALFLLDQSPISLTVARKKRKS